MYFGLIWRICFEKLMLANWIKNHWKFLDYLKFVNFNTNYIWQLKATNKVARPSKQEEKERKGGKVRIFLKWRPLDSTASEWVSIIGDGPLFQDELVYQSPRPSGLVLRLRFHAAAVMRGVRADDGGVGRRPRIPGEDPTRGWEDRDHQDQV